LLGTLYPLFVDALNLGKLSVGPPYFNSVFVPLMAPAAFLIGVGPIARWKHAKVPELAVRLRLAFGLSLLTAILLPFVIGGWKWRASLGLLLFCWIVATSVQNIWTRVRSQSSESSLLNRLKAPSRSYYGMQLAHIGVAVFIAGVTVVTSYQTEKDVKMNIGDTVSVGGYEFRLNNLAQYQGPNFRAMRADMTVTKNGAPVTVMYPEKRAFTASGNATSETAIDRSVWRDLYLSLGDEVPGGGWTVRVYHKPLVNWIWGGALLMAIGGGFAVTDRRYALASRKKATETPSGKPEQVTKIVTTAASSAVE
jgi:cytochrome c-type biogenesis protein CcmF